MKWIEDAKLRASVWLRERKERAEERKATAAAMSSEHGHGRFFLLHVPAMATICAAVVEWYWAILFCIEATGSIDWNFRTTSGTEVVAASVWNFAFETHWPIFLGLVCATIPIVMLSMVWLPVQFAMRGSGMWRRGTVIAVGVLANLLVIVSGTVVMNGNRQEQVRAGVVIEQTAAQGRAAIAARLEVAQTELARITAEGNTSNEARAARAGVAGWRTYVREAQNDPGVPPADRQRIVRAMGSAEAADALRVRIEQLTVERATAAPEAASAANVEDRVGRELNTFAQAVEVWRPPFVAVICCLIGIFGAWWVLALMQGFNPRDVLRSGWADEGHRIEDMREAAKPEAQPMDAFREGMFDAETGEELVPRRATWAKKPKKKGKAEPVNFAPDIPPDERGVETDGGGRIGMTIGGPIDLDALSEEPGVGIPPAPFFGAERSSGNEDDVQGRSDQNADEEAAQQEPSLEPPSEEEAEALLQQYAEQETEQADDEQPVQEDDAQPQTNPARLIAAE